MDSKNLLRRPFRYSYRSVTAYLIGANVLVFAASYLFPSLPWYLALDPGLVLRGMFWQPLTYMFAHGSVTHLLFNMMGLLFFGFQVEREFGSREYLLFYFVTGILSGLLSFGLYLALGSPVVLLGASGAVFAVLLAFAVLFPQTEIYVMGILPLRAPVLVALYALVEIGDQVLGFGGSVAHLTHLAALLFAWFYFPLRFGVHPWQRLFPRR
jgi:membrane associated rhomboid family serine protease